MEESIMKKALSLILAILVAFSMFAVVAAAEGETADDLSNTVKVTFVISEDPLVEEVVYLKRGEPLTQYTPENPVKQNTDTTRYTFKGWRSEADGQIYYKSTIPTPDESTYQITYTAVFSEEDISGRQSFWNLIESIFERINKIFEYFAIVFNW